MMRKAACLLALAAPAHVAAQVFPPPVSAMSFMPAPGYTGPLNTVAGMVLIGQDNMDTLVMYFMLTNVDGRCASSSSNTNGCGIHVHSGTNCSVTGGHFYDMALSPDPWLTVSYMANNMNGTMGAGVRVKAGKTLADVAGKVVVVHDYTGSKISCSPLMVVPYDGDTLIAGTFTKAAGYSGALTTTLSGMAGVMQVSAGPMASQVIAFNLTGADPGCNAAALGDVPTNGCGIHIHSGMNCSAPGGHYFTGNMGDPWLAVKYTTTSTGISSGVTPPVPTGLMRADVTNKVIMVHDGTGKAFACAPILMTMPGGSGSGSPNANFAKATFASPAVLAFLAAAKLLF